MTKPEAPPQKQLDGFMAKYEPTLAAKAKKALRKMRARLPGAIEMVYDNFNWLVIGFSPTPRPSEAMFSLVLVPSGWVTLCFLRNGAKLKDPNKLLRGSGKRIRNIRLEGAGDLDSPAVEALIAQSLKLAGDPFEPSAPRKLVIKAVSAKQRPRRPQAA